MNAAHKLVRLCVCLPAKVCCAQDLQIHVDSFPSHAHYQIHAQHISAPIVDHLLWSHELPSRTISIPVVSQSTPPLPRARNREQGYSRRRCHKAVQSVTVCSIPERLDPPWIQLGQAALLFTHPSLLVAFFGFHPVHLECLNLLIGCVPIHWFTLLYPLYPPPISPNKLTPQLCQSSSPRQF
jgi:hypothetical protein